MPRSILGEGIGRGLDQLLETLAYRDFQRQKEKDRQRQAEIDAANMAFRKADDERADRAEQRHIIAEANDTLNRRAAAVAKQAEVDKEEAQFGDFINSLDPNVRIKAFETREARKHGVDPKSLEKPKSPEEIAAERKTHMQDLQDEAFARARGGRLGAPPVGRASGPKEDKDDPTLPLGTKRWIESIALRGGSIKDARAELNNGWSEQLKYHPKADLGKAARHLDTMFPDDKPLSPAQPSGRASGAGPAAGAAPVPAPAPAPAAAAAPMTAPIRGIPGGVAASMDGGKTWKRIK